MTGFAFFLDRNDNPGTDYTVLRHLQEAILVAVIFFLLAFLPFLLISGSKRLLSKKKG